MVDRHYDDEALISFLESSATASDPHLLACGDCRETLDTLRSISCAMADEAVWQPPVDATPNPRTIATLRAFADNMTREDAEAEALLPVLIADARLAALPEYQTAGVVRRLLAAADRAIDTMPRDAVALTALATAVADAIDASRYESDAVAKLRGAAWRDYAYALYYTGSFADAERAVLTAESHFSDCVVGEYEGARVGVVRALVYRAMDRNSEAAAISRINARTFAAMGDTLRFERARSLEAAVSYRNGEYREALAIWSHLSHSASPALASEMPDIWQNIAACHRELGDVDAALRFAQMSIDAYSMSETKTEALRARWNVARMLVSAGRSADAVSRLIALQEDFGRLSMSSEAALVSLDLAELLLAEGRAAEVAKLCRTAMRYFENVGIAASPQAMTALGYLREASSCGVASVELVQHVRTYVRRLQQEPQLLFAPPPA
ncbi:MAG TPA: hypothetical protein VGF48_01455 [Thermoanaerobaculia bacterium]|jgi:tetratricopeptide (TPR) repeat protein